jgi:hypothetical protein
MKKWTDFLIRQYTSPLTQRQKLFDLVFGVLLPFTVLLIDPIMFKSGWPFFPQKPLPSLFGFARVFCYGLIGMGMFGLIVSLFSGKRSPWLTTLLAGFFALGAHLSLLTAMFLLGLMTPTLLREPLVSPQFPFKARDAWLFLACLASGLILLCTGFVYSRNSYKGLLQGFQKFKWHTASLLFLAGLLLIPLIPAGMQIGADVYVDIMMTRLIADTVHIDPLAIRGMQLAFWCEQSCYAPLIHAYQMTTSETKHAQLEEIYFQINGISLSEGIYKIFD